MNKEGRVEGQIQDSYGGAKIITGLSGEGQVLQDHFVQYILYFVYFFLQFLHHF